MMQTQPFHKLFRRALTWKESALPAELIPLCTAALSNHALAGAFIWRTGVSQGLLGNEPGNRTQSMQALEARRILMLPLVVGLREQDLNLRFRLMRPADYRTFPSRHDLAAFRAAFGALLECAPFDPAPLPSSPSRIGVIYLPRPSAKNSATRVAAKRSLMMVMSHQVPAATHAKNVSANRMSVPLGSGFMVLVFVLRQDGDGADDAISGPHHCAVGEIRAADDEDGFVSHENLVRK